VSHLSDRGGYDGEAMGIMVTIHKGLIRNREKNRPLVRLGEVGRIILK
jgi:hypothetical protein